MKDGNDDEMQRDGAHNHGDSDIDELATIQVHLSRSA
jgi:hypothetical protein